VATVSFHDQPVLWNVSNPERPAKIATLPGAPDVVLWGQAFSPDGRILAAAHTRQIDLWNVSKPARPRRLTTLGFDAAALRADVPAVADAATSHAQPGSIGDVAESVLVLVQFEHKMIT